MNIEQTVARDLLSIQAVFFRPEQPFTWASGIKSPVYCDNRLILTAPAVRDRVEQAIADTEERIAQLEARMADPETYKSPDAAQKLAQEHRDAQEALDALYSDWEELSEAVSELP